MRATKEEQLMFQLRAFLLTVYKRVASRIRGSDIKSCSLKLSKCCFGTKSNCKTFSNIINLDKECFAIGSGISKKKESGLYCSARRGCHYRSVKLSNSWICAALLLQAGFDCVLHVRCLLTHTLILLEEMLKWNSRPHPVVK